MIPVGRILRVQGTIAITRSIGDPGFKEYLISEPFVNSIEIGDEDLFLILSSDGLFNCLEMEGLASFCRERKDNKNLAEEITEYAISSGSRDNVTSIVVDLRCFKKKLESEPDFSSDGEETAMEIESTPKAIQKKFHF